MNKLWIAQFSSKAGESIWMFEAEPTAEQLEDCKVSGQTLDGVYEMQQVSGPSLSGLPTDRELCQS